MALDYNIHWLKNQVKKGEEFEFFYYWGFEGFESIEKHGFSIWYKSPFTVDQVTYPTMQHYITAHKALIFEDYEQYDKILAAPTPKNAQLLGTEIKDFDEEHWSEHRYDIIKTGNIHKFNQYPSLAEQLLQSGNKVLVEASVTDLVWEAYAERRDYTVIYMDRWSHINVYGFALMGARDFLREFGLFDPLGNPIPMATPWKKFPDDPDAVSHKGPEQDYLHQFCKCYNTLSEKEQNFYKLTNPVPYDWYDIYEECDFLKLFWEKYKDNTPEQ